MKNTKGLQIGNLLYYKGTDSLCTVNLINGENHYDCRDEFGAFIPNGEYDLIPLTEEWLIKFGFQKQQCVTFDWKEEFIISPKNNAWKIGVLLGDYPETNPNSGCVSIGNFKDEEIHSIPDDLFDKEEWTKEDELRADSHTEIHKAWRQPIAYHINKVNQLQNLYFALTREELIIKE